MPKNEPLPEFARAWMSQWKGAAVALQRVRDEELAALKEEPEIVARLTRLWDETALERPGE